MGNGLMGRLAHVAHKRVVLDTDRAESELLLGAAIGANRVGRQPSELFHGGFGIGGHSVLVCFLLVCSCLLFRGE